MPFFGVFYNVKCLFFGIVFPIIGNVILEKYIRCQSHTCKLLVIGLKLLVIGLWLHFLTYNHVSVL